MFLQIFSRAKEGNNYLSQRAKLIFLVSIEIVVKKILYPQTSQKREFFLQKARSSPILATGASNWMARNEFLWSIDTDLRATASSRPRDYLVSTKAIYSPKQIPKLPKTSLQLSTPKQYFPIPRKNAKETSGIYNPKRNYTTTLPAMSRNWMIKELNYVQIHQDSFVGHIASNGFISNKIVPEEFKKYLRLSLVSWLSLLQLNTIVQKTKCGTLSVHLDS